MLRNKEVRRFASLFFFMAFAFVSIGFSIHMAAGILAVISAASYGMAFWLFTKARYQSIARISEQIDAVLHHEDRLYIGDMEEGELSILQSELAKMTLRIREQNELLKKEKNHLADSLADIAHQLRTPLTSVILILSLLEKAPDTVQQKALAREMEELLVRMDWLITSLLKLSRLDAGIVVFHQNQVDVDDLICCSLRPFQISMELHSIVLRTGIPKGLVITGDFDWLSEALQNILKNCMESAGDHGKIDITCKDTPLFTEITIHDSGKGIQKEELPFLFDRFYCGKSSGYGIGLALSRNIITRQGGTILAKNHPMGGAVFVIRFPK